jgi:hypothetical protein
MVALVPPVPRPDDDPATAPGCRSLRICTAMLSAMLLLPRQSVARSA